MKDLTVLNLLLAESTVTDIVTTSRIWTTWLPEQATLPAITCNYASEQPINTLAGDDAMENETITINCWAEDKATLVNMIAAVKTAMQGSAVRQAMLDLTDSEQGIHRVAIDYSVWG